MKQNMNILYEKNFFSHLAKVLFLALVLLSLMFFSLSCGLTKAKPPEQPLTGPGGKDYTHAEVTESVYGEGDSQYWIFEPASPVPESAPLIVFNHGWTAMDPRSYGAWIDHLVRKGNIVVYPRYQADLRTPVNEFNSNAMQAVKDAINILQSGGHVRPELDKFAIVGHSAGGQITANMAALALSSGFPDPKAVMPVQPGKSWTISERTAAPLEDLSKIPKNALLLCIVGDKDNIVRDVDAKKIYQETPQIPIENKDLVTLVSDSHGNPPLVANHFAPTARNEAKNTSDAFDYYGLWKLFDGLYDAAFYGINREYALGNTSQQRYMGVWSDGTPVKELKVGL